MLAESSTLNSPAEDPSAKDDDDDEVGGLHVAKPEAELNASLVAPRWPTRVFAINCLLKVMAACEGDEVHFDLSLAKQLQQRNQGRRPGADTSTCTQAACGASIVAVACPSSNFLVDVHVCADSGETSVSL